MTTDAELLARAENDPRAFREIYDRYAANVHGFFVRRCHNRDVALDLTAETFAQAWQSRHHFVDHRDGSLGPWLFGIARNVLTRSVREQRISASASERLGLLRPASSISPEEVWLDDLDADIAAALAELPSSQRRAVQLRVIDGLDYREVSDELHCSPVAARIRVSRGLDSLRSTLSPKFNPKEITQ